MKECSRRLDRSKVKVIHQKSRRHTKLMHCSTKIVIWLLTLATQLHVLIQECARLYKHTYKNNVILYNNARWTAIIITRLLYGDIAYNRIDRHCHYYHIACVGCSSTPDHIQLHFPSLQRSAGWRSWLSFLIRLIYLQWHWLIWCFTTESQGLATWITEVQKNFACIPITVHKLISKAQWYNNKNTWLMFLKRTRNSSADEIANVNFLYDDIVHVLQNTIDSCINSATDRRGYVLELMFTKFSEITQYNGHYAVQGHSRSPILVPSKAHIRLPISD